MTSKRKKGSKQHRPRPQSSVHQASDVLDVSDDNTVTRSDGEGSSDRVFSTEEFNDPFDLSGFGEGLRERMLVAAPMLKGRDAEYGREFFSGVIGLSDQGPLLKDVAKCYGFITDEEIGAVWKTGLSKGRYEFSRCEDEGQLKTFGQQYFKVYGNRPHNNYFCLRFLRACYATFVYGRPVNWCAEALDRHQSRLKSASRNPSKLGPVATRCQVEGLCSIIKELSVSKGGGPDDFRPDQELRDALELEHQQAEAVKILEEHLHETRQRYNAVMGGMLAESSEIAEADINDKYVAKLREARQILREQGPTVEYKAAIADSEVLYKGLAEMREADARIRDTLVELELEISNEAKVLENAKADLTKTKGAVYKARGLILSLKTPRVFEYPKDHSVPPLGYQGKETCAYCGLGFAWKAAILSSCGCLLHPPCVAEVIACQNYRCNVCKDVLLASSPIHLVEAWVAQFGGKLNNQQETECSSFAVVLKAANDSANTGIGLGGKS